MTRVLVIEDDLSVGAAVQMFLERVEYATLHASDADSGLKAFEPRNFDLAIVNIFMSGMSGIEVIARLMNCTLAVPVMAMSGFRFRGSMDPDTDVLRLAAKAGATACLRKPFMPWQLMNAVYATLDTASAHDRVRAKPHARRL